MIINPQKGRRSKDSELGIVVGILIATENGLVLCDDTPEALREADFVHVSGNRAVFAQHLYNRGSGHLFGNAQKCIERKAEFIEWMKYKNEIENESGKAV